MKNFIDRFRYYPIYKLIFNLYPKKKRILDFGCGRGELVSYLRRKGWDAYGVDPEIGDKPVSSEDAFFYSLENIQRNIREPFDVVILNFSLEHCKDPALILRQLYGALASRGVIFIRVPSYEHILRQKVILSFQSKIFGHRHFFSRNSLKKIINDSGFSILEINTRFCIAALITIPCSIFPALDPMIWLYEKNKIVKLTKGAILGLLSLFFLPLILFESLVGQGAIISVVAKKVN